MKSRGIAFVALVAFCAALWSANPAAVADQGKDAELLEKIRQLEKRVAELEKQIKELRAAAKQAPRTDLEGKLIGTWVIVDADKKGARITDMKLNGDGTCTVAIPRDGPRAATYTVVGKQIAFHIPLPGGAFGEGLRITSVTDSELVAEGPLSGNLAKIVTHRYARVK